MQIYNTLTKQKEEFIPREGKNVRLFVCGPTVYDHIHIGNARTFVFFDVVAKYLRHLDYKVQYIQNITDVDDKIIKRAQEENRDPLELAKDYEKKFLADVKAVGISSVSQFARATDHINEVVAQVQTLIKKGHAYLIKSDGWYFDLSTFSEYGKLSGRTAEMADDAVSRIDENDKKRNRGDFCLWKFSKEDEPSWETGLGKGRPGWHIEDTAITEKLFGPQYDLHGGGQDLMFPHHEAEIAQQESASGLKPFVRYWMHAGFLINTEKKMSKSLSNFLSLNEALKSYSPETLRFYFLSAHYRSPLDFSKEILKQAEAAIQRITEFTNKLRLVDSKDKSSIEKRVEGFIKHQQELFIKVLGDDFNTPQAIAEIFGLIRAINSLPSLGKNSAKKILDSLEYFNAILGIIPSRPINLPPELIELINKRESAREIKDFAAADQLRSQIESLGYQIDDTLYGPLVKKK